MFSPREVYKTAEEFLDHLAETTASEFRCVKAYLESELAIIREEAQHEMDDLKQDLQTLGAQLNNFRIRLEKEEDARPRTLLKVDSGPAGPVYSEAPQKSQEEISVAGSSA